MKIRLYADFNNSTEDDKVKLNSVASLRDIEMQKQHLKQGLIVILSDNEVEVEARLERDERWGIWLGLPDWSTRRFLN